MGRVFQKQRERILKTITKNHLYDEFNREFDCCRPTVKEFLRKLHLIDTSASKYNGLIVVCPICNRIWFFNKNESPYTKEYKFIENSAIIPFGWEDQIGTGNIE
jgi:hypothetical protein